MNDKKKLLPITLKNKLLEANAIHFQLPHIIYKKINFLHLWMKDERGGSCEN